MGPWKAALNASEAASGRAAFPPAAVRDFSTSASNLPYRSTTSFIVFGGVAKAARTRGLSVSACSTAAARAAKPAGGNSA